MNKLWKELRKEARKRFGKDWKAAYKYVKNETKKRQKQGSSFTAVGKGPDSGAKPGTDQR